MAKKGVFGLKHTPLDQHDPIEPHSVHVKIAKGGFIVHTKPGKSGPSDSHIALDMSAVEKLVKAHFAQIIANDLDGVTNSMKALAAPKAKE